LPVSVADLDQAVANFDRWKSMGQDVPIDYDHSFGQKGDSKAAGWFADLKRVGGSLIARVRWTQAAAEKIANQEYRYFSPEWTRDWTSEHGEGEGFTILAGALTNRPFLRGRTAVAMTQEHDAEIGALSAELDELLARDDVDPAQLALHARAVHRMAQRPGLDYETAAYEVMREEEG
jgi:phage I-like protein